ncbi:MAG: signal recognition particle-docking protein FtsY [Bacteroidaceae bacterium]|nr:signal recognition particle-docking protein FtsY [Bacteroidaceae bacterium]MBR3634469.1 signal recognition particle-docking protein FtsY [Bacteroidaceae bacterium]MBR6713898.1 signal recognition particle-docking protein FtsY [Bacteroidaceae bacterium]
MGFFKFFKKEEKKEEQQQSLDKGLEKTRTGFFDKLTRAVAGKSTIDDEVLDNLEETLMASDVGVDTTLDIVERVQERVKRDKYIKTSELNALLRDEIAQMLQDSTDPTATEFLAQDKRPYVIMVVGVNGVGKTTTIGKLAHMYKQEGFKVVLGAADTFRAAAIEQLEAWAKRVDVPVIKQQMGSDPASVAYDTLQHAIHEQADVVIIDTAGRLHNKVSLMNELSKIKKVMGKLLDYAPNDVMLVLDGSTGQNAFEQAKQFSLATEISSLAITKLDGTARGGVVIGISHQMQIPVKYIGVGEGIDDLMPFDKKAFVDSLFKA